MLAVKPPPTPSVTVSWAFSRTTYVYLSCLQVAIGLGALLWGPASDRYGRKPMLVIATALFALTNVPLILAPNVAVLVAFRTLQVGEGW